MSKAQSTQLKGIAILMMLFLHLFNHWTPGEYTPWFLLVKGHCFIFYLVLVIPLVFF